MPRITTFAEDARVLAGARRDGRGFLLVTGHVGNWEMGAVTLRRHDLAPAVVGQPELDPNVQEMRLQLRTRLGVESIDIGSSMATAFKVRAAVDRGRAVALLVDRAYPEDQVIVPFFGRPTPFLRSPALLARFCGCDILPGFFLRNAGRLLLQRLGRAALCRSGRLAGRRCGPPDDPCRRGPRARHPRASDAVVQFLPILGSPASGTRILSPSRFGCGGIHARTKEA